MEPSCNVLEDIGNELLLCTSSTSVDELLKILGRAESILSKVEQLPPKRIVGAITPSIDALSREDILNHADMDIKAAVASCLCEIVRITAPEAPFDDEKTKVILELMVSCFKDLSDSSSPSYTRRISVLESFNKFRFCVVMLDLECDSMVNELFQTFLRSIRDYHPNEILSSMVEIITLLLEESESISLDMISPLLVVLKKDNQNVLASTITLAERVFQNCATKINPVLMKAAWLDTLSFEEYKDVVGNICGVTRFTAPQETSKKVVGEDLTKEDACTKVHENVDARPKRQRKKKVFFGDEIEDITPFMLSRGKESSNSLSSKKKNLVSPKPLSLCDDHEDQMDETSKRKSRSNKEKEVVIISTKPSFKLLDEEDGFIQSPERKHNMSSDIVYDESLVSSRIKVWWPTHNQFYECVICSFDSVDNKYKVLYDDWEVEILNLKNETWEIV